MSQRFKSTPAPLIPGTSNKNGAELVNAKFFNQFNILNMNLNRIENLGTALLSTDAVNKQYVDEATSINWKQPVKVATTANITLSGSQTIDDILVVDGDRVLVKNQTDPIENGYYNVVDSGAWTRTEDMPVGDSASGYVVMVNQGTVNEDTSWTVCSDPPNDIVGTDPLNFCKLGPGIFEMNSLTSGLQFMVTGTTGTDFTISSVGDTHTFNIPTASATSTGKLSSTDWSIFDSKLESINTLTSLDQLLVTGTTGTDFTISSVGDTHTFNIPIASATNTGKLSSTDWTTFNNKADIGGINTEVQFNNSGVLGGSSDFTWDGTSLQLTDGKNFTVGTDDDLVITHSGLVGSITNISGDLTMSNTSITSDIIMKLGTTATKATSFRVQDSAAQDKLYVEMDGAVWMPQIRSGVSGNALAIVSGEIVDSVSLRKYKKDEVLVSQEPNFDVRDILKLEPKFFTWKKDGTRDLGLIVEDALDLNFDHFIYNDPTTGPHNYKDRSLIAALIAIVKDQDRIIGEIVEKLKN